MGQLSPPVRVTGRSPRSFAVEVVVRSVVLTVTGVVTVANEVKVVFVVRVVEVMAVVSVGMTNVDVNEAMAMVV